MSFDISTATNIDASSAGAPMKLVNPATGDYLKDAAGEFVTITLRGRNSREGQAAATENLNRTLDLQRRGQVQSAAHIEANIVALLVACTVAWAFDQVDGADFPCTPANAAKFWSDARFKAYREQADAFIGAEANFTKR
jgi:hypothetical protein